MKKSRLTESQIVTVLREADRDSVAAMEWFRHRLEAKIAIEQWCHHYNEVRPRIRVWETRPLRPPNNLLVQHPNRKPSYRNEWPKEIRHVTCKGKM